MPLRKPHIIRAVSKEEVDQINENWDVLYKVKLESRFKTFDSGVRSFIFQSQEFGETTFSATGSPTVAKTFALAEKYANILYVNAHAQSILIDAIVTDITNSSLTVTCVNRSGSNDFSAATTAAISVFYQVVGNNT